MSDQPFDTDTEPPIYESAGHDSTPPDGPAAAGANRANDGDLQESREDNGAQGEAKDASAPIDAESLRPSRRPAAGVNPPRAPRGDVPSAASSARRYESWAMRAAREAFVADHEFSIHRPNERLILESFRRGLPEFAQQVISSGQTFAREAPLSVSMTVRRLRVLLIAISVVFALAAGRAVQIQVFDAGRILDQFGDIFGSGPGPTDASLGVRIAFLTVGLAALVGLLISILGLRRTISGALLSTADDFSEIPAKFRVQVKANLRVVMNRLYRTELGLVFQIPAPALVATTTSENLVSNRALGELQAFISDHESSSLGLAGPRGSGKTSTLQMLARNPAGDPSQSLSVFIPAPVQYDTTALVKLITVRFLEAAVATDDRAGLRESRPPMGGRPGLAPLFLAILGCGLAVYGWRDPITQQLPDDWFPWLGVVVAAAGLAWGAVVLARGQFPRIAAFWLGLADSRVSWADELRLAHEKIQYSWETGQSRGATISIGDTASASRETSHHFAETPRARSDWSREFERLTSLFLKESRYSRVVLLLDELDKLPSGDAVVQVLNEVKDLMHVPGVHFVASISDDALDQFSLRSMPLRNAVDSTFDDVIRMDGLSCEEATALVESRVGVFPRPLTLFCYAWSGRNARDFIRNARNSVRVPPAAQGSISQVVQTVLWSDVRAVVASHMRRSGLVGSLTANGRAQLRATLGRSDRSAMRDLGDIFATLDEEFAQPGDLRSLVELLRCAADILDEFSDDLEVANWTRDDPGGPLSIACTEYAQRLDDLRATWPSSARAS